MHYLQIVFVIFVIITIPWVHRDATRRGIRKGLIPGIADMSPSGWAWAFFLAWPIAFPLYLINLKKLTIEAARQGPAPEE